MNPEQAQTVRRWIAAVQGRFFMISHLAEGTIFLAADARIYSVIGLNVPIPEIYDIPLPTAVDAVLLPFKGRVVFDGVIGTHRIAIGPNMSLELTEEYLTAKKRGEVISSFDQLTSGERISDRGAETAEDE